MNREIKFIRYSFRDEVYDHKSEWGLNVGDSTFSSPSFNQAFIHIDCQFTGINDKNGKEIYEGDILKFHYFFQSLGENLGVKEDEHELIGVVHWGEFGWGIESIKGEHWQSYTGYDSEEGNSNFIELSYMNESSIHEESFEIIGNIYENPELLSTV